MVPLSPTATNRSTPKATPLSPRTVTACGFFQTAPSSVTSVAPSGPTATKEFFPKHTWKILATGAEPYVVHQKPLSDTDDVKPYPPTARYRPAPKATAFRLISEVTAVSVQS